MGKHLNSIDNKIISRIYGLKRGIVFTPKKFRDLGSKQAVFNALKRYVESGTIRRLAPGLYDYPRKHPKLGLIAPSVDSIANALKGSEAIRIQPSGAYAANLTGLSEQLPMKIIFLTDGPRKLVKVGRQEIRLIPTTPRMMAMSGKISGLVTQALKHMGKQQIDEKMIAKLKKRLSQKDKKQLLDDISYPPAWIGDIFRTLANE
ncbi:MAG: DUF6088 family protein [Verrucomicrobiota bacterium]